MGFGRERDVEAWRRRRFSRDKGNRVRECFIILRQRDMGRPLGTNLIVGSVLGYKSDKGDESERIKGRKSADEGEIIISHRRGLNHEDGFGGEEDP